MKIRLLHLANIEGHSAANSRINGIMKMLEREGNTVSLFQIKSPFLARYLMHTLSIILVPFNLRNYDILLLSSSYSIFTKLYLVISLYFTSTILVQTVDEKYSEKFGLSLRSKWFKKLYLRFYHRYDLAVISITKSLGEIIRSHFRFTGKLLLLPMTVDEDRFLNEGAVTRGDSLVWIANDRDGLKEDFTTVIKAFEVLYHERVKVNLHVYGHVNDGLISLVNRLNLQGLIIFKGVVPSSDIPSILQSSAGALLIRKSTEQNSFGFPTKLGEFLMSGTPTIVTDVGEISNYLSVKDCFLIPENDSDALVEAIISIIGSRAEAKEKAWRGREVAMKYFSLMANGRELHKFLTYLLNENTSSSKSSHTL